MARRLLVIGVFVALVQLAVGCHHRGHIRKYPFGHFHDGCCEPAPCCSSCASPVVAPPIVDPEALPAPKRMPATTMTGPVRVGLVR